MCPLFSLTGAKSLEEMTWKEVADKLKKTKTVLIPVGSIEAHGPHLPLATDAWTGVEMVKRAAVQLEKKGLCVVAGPVIPFGVCPYWLDFPGSLNFKQETVMSIIKDMCSSLYQHGFRIFYLVLAHGGNFGAMQVAAQDLCIELEDARVVVVNWLPYMIENGPSLLSSQKPEDHAGEDETSLMLVTAPEFVRMDCAREFYPEKLRSEISYDEQPVYGGGVGRPMAHAKRDYSELALIGNPKLASEETGEKYYQMLVDWICTIIEQDLRKRYT